MRKKIIVTENNRIANIVLDRSLSEIIGASQIGVNSDEADEIANMIFDQLENWLKTHKTKTKTVIFALSQALFNSLLHGLDISEEELQMEEMKHRKFTRCTSLNAPDIEWPSKSKTNHSDITPAQSKDVNTGDPTNGDQK